MFLTLTCDEIIQTIPLNSLLPTLPPESDGGNSDYSLNLDCVGIIETVPYFIHVGVI